MKSRLLCSLGISIVCALLHAPFVLGQAGPEPAGWYAGDMHVHRSCGGSPESVSSMFSRMTPQNLAVVSQLADSGNGEVQDATTDLPLVNGQDDPISTIGQILHWDAEWHWDATYTQYPHQALGGHIVTLGLSSAQQIWQEYTFPILDWAHQHNGIAGFAHLQYLDGTGLPSSLTCCTPIEYPVEVALGAADFISEDVDDVNQPGAGGPMYSETPIQAYYKLLNSGFRPGLAAGTDYPCNGSDNGGALGGLLTYAQVANGQLTYRNWIQGISSGRTVVSRNGHNEFLSLTVNGAYTPGDEIALPNAGNVTVTVQWTAEQNLSGTIELVQNGNLIVSQPASAGLGAPATLTATVNFANSGWLVARRMGTNPLTNNYEHYVHTAAVFVIVNNAPIRAYAADAQYFVDWTNGLLQNTSPGGTWNSFFPTSLTQAQARYQAAKALYQQIASEASGSGPTLSSIALTPNNQTFSAGSQASFSATGTYSNGSTLNITGQVRWTSSNPAVATISTRGLASAISQGSTAISASLSGVTSITGLTVTPSPLVISTQSLAGAIVGISYSTTLAATGGTLPYAWSIVSGSLPPGLSLNTATGGIAGTPITAGSYGFTAQAADASSPQQTATVPLTIVVTSSAGGPCPCSIWPSTLVPGIPDSGPDSAVELGVKFRSDINGYITGVRFYKGAENTGAHVGNLWSSTGTQLATAAFTNETATGWQQVNFSSPVPVLANTIYVASYFTPTGYYADDTGYFSQAGVDNPPLHALADGSNGPNGLYSYGSTSSFPSLGWQSSNYWVDAVFVPASSTTPPTINSVAPPNNSPGVSLGPTVTATFSEPMAASTINTTTLFLLDPLSNVVPATVAYNLATSTATLTPTFVLTPLTTYTVTIRGGSNGVTDFNGNPLANDFTWSFTTGTAPANTGPGGPILVISNVLNPFSRYYGEMLNAEGLNYYTVADISTITPTTLGNYDVAILGDMSLSSDQTTMFANWVSGGGNLIAMHPDKQLAGLLGLTPTSSTQSNGYMLVQTSSGPGVGIVGQTIQYHGSADLYTLNGATSLATLYSTASASTNFPAVTLATSGSGQAAAFTYDLARSIVYTRQGNPAWSGQKRDGEIPPIRSDDLYFGAASFDPEPDWVDLNKVTIPQADEQQRLLANLILQMDAARKPLPRYWYFPSGFKAVVIMTGDDHGTFYSASATSQRFDDDLAASTVGCSVADWQCVRATAYLFPQALATNPLTDSQVAAYTAQGFEVSVHADSNPTCSDWTTAELDSQYKSLIASLAAQFPSLPAPQTHRMHCIGWSDYDSQPQVELKYGIRLDTSYYYWPPTWVNDHPGMFTGSGMPMRFTDRNGNVINVYQATTQMTDESGQSYPLNTDTLLNNALGATGYYGAFAVNAHNDQDAYPGIAPAVIASAQSHGVPIVSSLQMLTWLDGRNTSSFQSLSWSGNTLYFSIVPGAGARNLQAMLPTSSTSGNLSAITQNGIPVSFSTQTIKGIQYAFFAAVAGSYQATYGTGGFVISGLISGPGGPGATVSLTGSATATTTADGLGNYSFAGLANGSYTVTPSKPGYVFNPGSQPVTVNGANATAVGFTSTPSQIYSLSGTISPPGGPGATVSLTGASTATVTADGSGNYSFNALGNGSYTVTPTNTGFVFTPSAQNTTINGGNVSGLNFATLTLTSITLNPTSALGGSSSTGTVTLNGPAPTGGAVVTLSSNNTGATQVPASVTVAANATTATFPVTTSPVGSNTSLTISGTYGATQSANFTVTAAVLSSVSVNPASLVGGAAATGTVTLNGPAPAGGAAVALSSSNTGAAQVQATVTVAANATTATFPVTTSPVASNASVTISGTYVSNSTATLTVTAATLSSVTLNPTTVTGGNTSTGTVTLNGLAPAGGAVVTLSSNNTAAAQVPASVTVAPNATTATFPVTTSPVASNTPVTITGTFGTTQTASLTVQSAALSSVSLSPASVLGGTSSTGTVRLSRAAPAGGAVVTLSSSNAAVAQVPASVTVAANATTATFPVTTSPVASNASVTISGTYVSTRTATLTVTAATLSTVTLNPASVVGGRSSTGTVTLSGPAPAGGAVVTLSSNNTAVAQVPTSVMVAANATTATFPVTTSPVASTASVTISGTFGTTRTATFTVTPATLSSVTLNPTTVIGGNTSTGTVTLNAPALAGGAVVTLSSSNTNAAQVQASVTVAANATTATFPVTTSPVATNTSVTVTGTFGTTRTASMTVQSGGLNSVSLSPVSVTGGTSSTGTVRLSRAAPAGGAVVALSSNNAAAAQVPASVTVAPNATTATFPVTTSPVASNASVTISGTYISTRTATLTVTAPTLSSLTLNPTTVKGPAPSTGTVTLNGPAPSVGATVALSSSNAGVATVPASVTVSAGNTTATFTVSTKTVSTTTSVTISGTKGTTRTSVITVTP